MSYSYRIFWLQNIAVLITVILVMSGETAYSENNTVVYKNNLVKIENPPPILADYPDFVKPLHYEDRYLASPVITDKNGDVLVRSWRYWANAHGIVEMENRLDSRATAVINLNAWGTDDGRGIVTSETAEAVLSGTLEKNSYAVRQIDDVVNPFIERLRKRVVLIGHTLPGHECSIRKLLYPSMTTKPEDLDVAKGTALLAETIQKRQFSEEPVKKSFMLDSQAQVTSYFQQLSESTPVNNYGGAFSDLPIPLMNNLTRGENDIVFYDEQPYEELRNYLKTLGIRHILLVGIVKKQPLLPTHPRVGSSEAQHENATEKGTVCDFESLRKDFNVFIVGDAVRTTYPASTTPQFAVQATLAQMSGRNMITQANWVRIKR